jgi:hypothetical protein
MVARWPSEMSRKAGVVAMACPAMKSRAKSVKHITLWIADHKNTGADIQGCYLVTLQHPIENFIRDCIIQGSQGPRQFLMILPHPNWQLEILWQVHEIDKE